MEEHIRHCGVFFILGTPLYATHFRVGDYVDVQAKTYALILTVICHCVLYDCL